MDLCVRKIIVHLASIDRQLTHKYINVHILTVSLQKAIIETNQQGISFYDILCLPNEENFKQWELGENYTHYVLDH